MERTMKTLDEQLKNYNSYHTKFTTRLTHYIGIPLIAFSVLIFMHWFSFSMDNVFSLSFAWLLTLAVLVYYFMLDWQLAGGVAIGLIILNLLALWLGGSSFNTTGFIVFLVCFIGGWALQLGGHFIEGNKPALCDSLCQVFIAPLFLVAEIFFMAGLRKDLKNKLGE
jgi:uncharacterized membrane protein YGL010W